MPREGHKQFSENLFPNDSNETTNRTVPNDKIFGENGPGYLAQIFVLYCLKWHNKVSEFRES